MKTTPRKVYEFHDGYVGPGEKQRYYLPKILWAEFDGWGLVSSASGSNQLDVVSMNVICEEGDKEP